MIEIESSDSICLVHCNFKLIRKLEEIRGSVKRTHTHTKTLTKYCSVQQWAVFVCYVYSCCCCFFLSWFCSSFHWLLSKNVAYREDMYTHTVDIFDHLSPLRKRRKTNFHFEICFIEFLWTAIGSFKIKKKIICILFLYMGWNRFVVWPYDEICVCMFCEWYVSVSINKVMRNYYRF